MGRRAAPRKEKPMAIIDCPECGKQVSERARACPDCGYPVAAATAEPALRRYSRIVQRHKRGIFFFCTIPAILVWMLSARPPTRYEATAAVAIEKVDIPAVRGGGAGHTINAQAEAVRFLSEDVLLTIAQAVKLEKLSHLLTDEVRQALAPDAIAGPGDRPLRGRLDDLFRAEQAYGLPSGPTPGEMEAAVLAAKMEADETVAQIREALRSDLHVNHRSGSNVLDIRAVAEQRAEAAGFANTAAKVFVDNV